MPTRWLSVYSPTKGASVAAWRNTAYSAGLSSACHCSSVFTTDAEFLMLVMSCSTIGGPLVFRAALLLSCDYSQCSYSRCVIIDAGRAGGRKTSRAAFRQRPRFPRCGGAVLLIASWSLIVVH